MRVQTVLVFCAVFGLSYGMVADIYLNKDKFGEYFKLEISQKGCTNVPLNWENQAVSVDTHGSCIKFYDLPYCRGKYVALQPYHGTFQDNLATLGFSKLISSASPCGPKVPTGRYYIQNGADGSVLTIETRNNTPVARTYLFKPYISKGQQFQVEKVALADYEIIPRIHQKMNPVTFDMTVSTSAHPVRRTWKIESVYRGRYLIKNEWSNRCLYKAEDGKVEEHECVAWSPNQEWIFRSIKVKPYFPSKEDLKKKPLRPDSDFPFEPQEESFSSVPYNPKNPANGQSGKRPAGGKVPGTAVVIQRPGPLVISPGEPFPPVFPFPIRPSLVNSSKKKASDKPPVPHIRHPGPLPFPLKPLVTDPKKPAFSPFDTYNVFGNNKNSQKPLKPKEADEEKDDNDDDPDDKKSEEQNQDELEQESGERDEAHDDDVSDEQDDHQGTSGPGSYEHNKGTYGDQKGSDEQDEKGSYERDEDEESADDNVSEEIEEIPEKLQRQKEKEEAAGINYSDYRLYF